MARPRSNENMPTAPQRLASAFWEMLVEMPFSQITVSSLSARAHVNHNTFYYYFDSMEDMAKKLFERNMMPDLPRMLLPLVVADSIDLSQAATDPAIDAHFQRACLFARSDSALLVRILKDSITTLWLDTVGLDRTQLSRNDEDRLSFVFGGLVACIGGMGADASTARLSSSIVASPLGQGIFENLAQLAATAR